MSLEVARRKYHECGAIDEELLGCVRKPLPDEIAG